MDSDDQNYNKSNHNEKVNENLLNDTEYSCCGNESTCFDKNGNNHVCSHNNNSVCNDLSKICDGKDEKMKSTEPKTITRLQALAMSDDEDYGEYLWSFMKCHGVMMIKINVPLILSNSIKDKKEFKCSKGPQNIEIFR